MGEMNRDPRVSRWAAQYIPPEEGDEQPEPVNVTRPRGKRYNPPVEAYLAEHPGEFVHRVTVQTQRRKTTPLGWALFAALVTWVAVFVIEVVRLWNA